MFRNPDSEVAIESAVMDLFESLGYEVVNDYNEISGVNHFGRATLDEVVLLSRLYPALQRLNPGVPQSVLETAVETLLADRSLSTLANANAQVYSLLKNGVKVTLKDEDENDIT